MDAKKKYEYVTQFAGKTIRYNAMTDGQSFALGVVERGPEGTLSPEAIRTITLVIEGCVGPDGWRQVSDGLALGTVSVKQLFGLFSKITEKTKTERDTATAVAEPAEA